MASIPYQEGCLSTSHSLRKGEGGDALANPSLRELIVKSPGCFCKFRYVAFIWATYILYEVQDVRGSTIEGGNRGCRTNNVKSHDGII
jgi:hypothetical protein